MLSRIQFMLGLLSLITLFFLTGCAQDTDIAAPASPANSTPAHVQTLKTDNKTNNQATENKVASLPIKNEISNTVQQASSDKPKTHAFNTKQPAIMGLSINDLQEKVVGKYGQPVDSYTMEDPKDPITVYQYEGFSVGFNAAKQIQYIDISSTSIDPGLNGLILGQTAAQATVLLGKPDKNTSYVIAYTTKKAVLKLDIDPKTMLILSIKLFKTEVS